MNLFSSIYNPSISSIQSYKRLSIQRPFVLNTVNPTTKVSNCSIFSSPSFCNNRSFPRPKCCTSSSSSTEPSTGAPAPSSTIIFVKGLPISISDGRLEMAFTPFGNVIKVKIITDKNTKQSLGFAYIWIDGEDAALRAVKEMNGRFLDGRFISVEIARPGSCVPRVKPIPFKF